ncbi:polysaccharide deacetylase family protein [Halarcobacter sp.]|uniref:polysaccharide deacetylase family protein n=1 Tax=Halarcobacter sp. TaxID=2321133 RepID=UPI002AAA8914|nr:polysaccharide deacetylase family protein [Halarcobacter sp.]
MIKITIPNNNFQERKYILDIIFNEFLGLEYQILKDDKSKHWEIELKNSKKLVFKDYFFNKFPKDLEYLIFENIPLNIKFGKNEFVPEENIPILYGNDKLEKFDDIIICSIDVFASSFFMLTRWEEYVNKNRDNHHRFPSTESLAYKNDFLSRPIVNEYIEMLKNMMLYLDSNLKFKTRNFQLILTHDVDFIYKWNTPRKFLRHLAGDIIRRKSPIEFIKSIISYISLKLNLKKDPFDTFEYLMDLSEKINIKSYFFFMAEGLTKYDNNYKSNSIYVKKLVNKIKKRGHNIGIHPTYNAYNDKKQFEKEKNELASNLETKVSFGRNHFLRFEVPGTWQVWEDNNMEWDSTLSYADKEGFRCGCCYEFSVFNILTRKKLKLKEKPLIMMESSLLYQNNINYKSAKNNILNLIEIIKRYDGNFVLLWHNSSFNVYEWKKFSNLYSYIISLINTER